MPALAIGRAATAARSRVVELVGVGERRLGQDDRELVAADAAGDVGRAHDVADALGRLGQHGVAGEVADAVVDRLEVVEVEDEQREPPVVALRAGDLARERLVEVAAVVQAGERVEVGELPRLAEAPRVLDRRARRAARAARARARSPSPKACRGVRVKIVRKPDRARSRRAAARRGPRGSCRRSAAAAGRVLVRDRDRARLAPVRRPGDRLAARLVLGEAERRDDRLRRVSAATLTSAASTPAQRAGRVERAREHLVEVDRAGELAERRRASRGRLGAAAASAATSASSWSIRAAERRRRARPSGPRSSRRSRASSQSTSSTRTSVNVAASAADTASSTVRSTLLLRCETTSAAERNRSSRRSAVSL